MFLKLTVKLLIKIGSNTEASLLYLYEKTNINIQKYVLLPFLSNVTFETESEQRLSIIVFL